MFRLIKAIAYGLLAYVIYELILGFTSELPSAGQSRSGRGQSSRQDNPTRRMGPARRGGSARRSVESHDADGATQRHAVGRGVVSR